MLIEFPDPLTLKTAQSFTQDISVGGVRFPTDVRLQMGHALALTLHLPFHNARFHATGEVVWLREIARLGSTQYEVGARFVWIDDPDRQRLTRHLQSVLSSKV
ncbi:MAG: hypothetical protein A3G88_02825 [Omnitrophica WOR_2 bacterium RIFCSPLOWO2_12_FULL_63_16]|nr:MAG: hypothetical protein A3G88_02825 [Omnitrophica WOR_2 bacterium RIFCSPLOWO2_12_FULL_63_16]